MISPPLQFMLGILIAITSGNQNQVEIKRPTAPPQKLVNIFFDNLDENDKCCVKRVEIAESSKNIELLSYSASEHAFDFEGTVLSTEQKTTPKEGVNYFETDDDCFKHIRIVAKGKDNTTKITLDMKRNNTGYVPAKFKKLVVPNDVDGNFCQMMTARVDVMFDTCEDECRPQWHQGTGDSCGYGGCWEGKVICQSLKHRIDKGEPVLGANNCKCKVKFGKEIEFNPIVEFLEHKSTYDDNYPELELNSIDWMDAEKFKCQNMKTTKITITVRIDTKDGEVLLDNHKQEIKSFNKTLIEQKITDDNFTCFDLDVKITVNTEFRKCKSRSCKSSDEINGKPIIFERILKAKNKLNINIKEEGRMILAIHSKNSNLTCLNKTASVKSIPSSNKMNQKVVYIQINGTKIDLTSHSNINSQCMETILKVTVWDLLGNETEKLVYDIPSVTIPPKTEKGILCLQVNEKKFNDCPKLMFEIKCAEAKEGKIISDTKPIAVNKENEWKITIMKVKDNFPNCSQFHARACIGDKNCSHLEATNEEHFSEAFNLRYFDTNDFYLKIVVPIATTIFILGLTISGCCAMKSCRIRHASIKAMMTNKIAQFDKTQNILTKIKYHLDKDLNKEFRKVCQKQSTEVSEDLTDKMHKDIHNLLAIKAPTRDRLPQFWKTVIDRNVKTLVILPKLTRELETEDTNEAIKLVPNFSEPELRLDGGIKIKFKSAHSQTRTEPAFSRRSQKNRLSLRNIRNSIMVPTPSENIHNNKIIITRENQTLTVDRNQETIKILELVNPEEQIDTVRSLVDLIGKMGESTNSTAITGHHGFGQSGILIALAKLEADYKNPEINQLNIFDTVHHMNKDSIPLIETVEEYRMILKCVKQVIEDNPDIKPTNTRTTGWDKVKLMVPIMFDIGGSVWTVVDACLDISTIQFYYRQWEAGDLAIWFLFFSVLAMLLPIVAMMTLIWVYLCFGMEGPRSQDYVVATFLTFLTPMMWISAPFLFLAVIIFDIFSVNSPLTFSRDRRFKRFLLLVMTIKCTEQCFEGFPQLLINAVFLSTNGINEKTMLTFISCFFSSGSLAFFLFLNLYKSVFNYERSLCGIIEQTLDTSS